MMVGLYGPGVRSESFARSIWEVSPVTQAPTPRLLLYSDAKCVGSRPELASILGTRVSVIGCCQESDGTFSYAVTARSKASPIYRCFENELIPLDPVPWVSDDEYMANIVAQTADLRYSEESRGLRQLLQERGLDPLKCLQISCDQGDDVAITLVLPDGTVVGADYRWDYDARQAVKFVAWYVKNYVDREIELCRAIVAGNDTSGFDESVRACFERDGREQAGESYLGEQSDQPARNRPLGS